MNEDFKIGKINFSVFSGPDMSSALRDCYIEGYHPLFFTELTALMSLGPDHDVLSRCDFSTPSTRVIGKDKHGLYTVFIHAGNYLNKMSSLDMLVTHATSSGSVPFPNYELIPYFKKNTDEIKNLRYSDYTNRLIANNQFLESALADCLFNKKSNASRFLEEFGENGLVELDLGVAEKRPSGRFLSVGRNRDGCLKIYAPKVTDPVKIIAFEP